MRSALDDVLAGAPVHHEDMHEKTDEQLLDTDLRLEYEMDSLDLEELRLFVDNCYNVKIDDEDMRDSSFYEEATVRNFIKMCQDYGHY